MSPERTCKTNSYLVKKKKDDQGGGQASQQTARSGRRVNKGALLPFKMWAEINQQEQGFIFATKKKRTS